MIHVGCHEYLNSLMNRELLIIDPHFAWRSPSLKSILTAMPKLLDEGWTIRVWCLEADNIDPRIIVEKFVSPSKIWFFASIWFWLVAHLRYWRTFRGKEGDVRRGRVLVQATGFYCIKADVLLMQFVFELYRRTVSEFSEGLRLSFKERVSLKLAVWQEKLSFRPSAAPRLWLVVSRRLADDLLPFIPACDVRKVVGNTWKPEVFNRAVGSISKPRARAELGIAEGEVVFVFVCLGAFERKGFRLALGACDLLNRQGVACRLLVIGGRTSEPPDISPWVSELGIADPSFVVLHGRTPRIAHLLSAGDALLFPSFFEAFANVSIEAAALGLRLYLTPHYGAEMMLGAGCAGRLLPWSAEGIAEVLAAEITSGAVREANSGMGLAPGPDMLAKEYSLTLHEAWKLRNR